MQSKVPAAIQATKSPGRRQQEFSEPRESCELPEPAVTLGMAKGQLQGSSSTQEDVLQEDLWSHGTEANTPSSLDPIRGAVFAVEGIAMALHAERRDLSLYPAHGAPWLGAAQQSLESAVA